MNNSPSHLLRRGKGADMVFSSTAGQNQAHRDVLLAGGFPRAYPDSPFPLSPTLQLNADLACFSETAMAAIGRAELVRANSQSFRSHVLKPDPRVTVLGADARAVNGFLDRYSGVLDIEPLLVTGSDPDLPTADNLEITNTEDGCRLSFTVKQPVDFNRCTYCGACGPVCPEQCLSELLYLDFSRCTLCNACVQICPRQAIDLHAVEQRVLQTPAVLVLDGTRIDLPQKTERIFTPDNLDQLFAAIYAAQVDEVISCNRSICQYSTKLGSGCTLCRESCPHEAISQNRENGVRIDHIQCTECGACLASCPTGALQYGRFTDTVFTEYFRTVSLPQNVTVVLGNEENLHQFWWQTDKTRFETVFFLEYPQPGALTSMHLFLLYAMGAGQIIILGQAGKAPQPVRLQIELVNAVLNALFNSQSPVLYARADTLAGELKKTHRQSPLTTLYHDFSLTNRREKLADLLSFLCRQSDAEPLRLTGAAAAVFGEVNCDREKCTLCTACVGECRIGALSADADNFSLQQLPALCVQCGTCVELCPEDALVLQPGLSLHADFFTLQLLARAEPVKCLECGKIFGTQQSLARVMAVLATKNMWDSTDELLHYCETCRVVKLYESQQ